MKNYQKAFSVAFAFFSFIGASAIIVVVYLVSEGAATVRSYGPLVSGLLSGLGALIGFFGLAAAALLNAELNRRRDDRIISYDSMSIANGLIGELLGNIDTWFRSIDIYMHIAEQNMEFHNDKDYAGSTIEIEMHPKLYWSFYNSNAAKICYVPVDILSDITQHVNANSVQDETHYTVSVDIATKSACQAMDTALVRIDRAIFIAEKLEEFADDVARKNNFTRNEVSEIKIVRNRFLKFIEEKGMMMMDYTDGELHFILDYSHLYKEKS